MKKKPLLAGCLFFLVQLAGAHESPGSGAITGSPGALAAVTGASPGITVAGGNGPGSSVNQLNVPAGVFVNANGEVYIADQNNNRIQKWIAGASSGTTVAGGNSVGAGANQLSSPQDVVVDAAGNIYIADRGNHRIQKWVPGALSGVTVAGGNGAGPAPNQLSGPSDIFVDAAGNLYIADEGNNRIQKWAPGAASGITVAGGNGYGGNANQFANPSGVFVDASGNIYVSDYYVNRVQKWVPGASAGITVAGGNAGSSDANQLNAPNDVFVDAGGNIFVTDTYNQRIQKWAPGASAGITVAGGHGEGAAANQLSYANGIFVDAAGNIYVADNGNHRIQKFPGTVSDEHTVKGITVAGGNGYGFAHNQVGPSSVFIDAKGNMYFAEESKYRVVKWAYGALSGITVAGGNDYGSPASQLASPTDAVADADGNVYIADRLNHRIQKWAPGASAGITVAGGNGQGGAANQLSNPQDIFLDAGGNIYVADQNNNRIQKWAPGASSGITVAGGNGSGSAANQFNGANGLFVDATGNIYVADFFNSRIQKWAPGASAGITVAGGNGNGSAANQLGGPGSVAVDATGNLYITDYFNDRIIKWAPGALAGTIAAGGNGRGSAADQLSSPRGIWVDTTGNLYVADAGNNRVQLFSPKGVSYNYYEGDWNSLPEFSALAPVKSGSSANLDINLRPAGRQDHYGFVWQGYINISTPGTYTFETVSDDGSRLYFNTLYSSSATPLVNNDGLHGFVPASGSVYIPALGLYPIAISYFQKTGAQGISVYWSGPGISRQLIPDEVFADAPGDATAPAAPLNLTVVSSGSSFVNLDWDDASDNIGVAGYNVFVNGKYTYTTTQSAITADHLIAGTTYGFTVVAFDRVLNRSAASAAVTAATTANTNSGLQYKVYQGDWDRLPDFSALTPVKTGTSPNVDINERPTGVDERFAMLWEGYINIKKPGTYTFSTVSDDGSRLYFNYLYSPDSIGLVVNDNLHGFVQASGSVNIPAAGAYPIAITYFNKLGGKGISVYWSGPGFSQQRIPDSAFIAPPAQPSSGLSYRVYQGDWNVLPDFNALTPVKTGNSTNVDISVRPAGVEEHFGIVWQGTLYITTSGMYTFSTVSDDGSRLYFNAAYSAAATPLVNNDGLHGYVQASGTANIPAAGAYPIAITLFNKLGGKGISVYWSGPGFSQQLIPDAAFVPAPPPAVTAAGLRAANAVKHPAVAEQLQSKTEITRVYPVPFPNRLQVDFYNSAPANDIRINICDANGRTVYSYHPGKFAAGTHTLMVPFSGSPLPDGMYLLTLQVNGIAAKPVPILKAKQ